MLCVCEYIMCVCGGECVGVCVWVCGCRGVCERVRVEADGSEGDREGVEVLK